LGAGFRFATAVFIQYISGKLGKGKTKFETSLKLEDLERGVSRLLLIIDTFISPSDPPADFQPVHLSSLNSSDPSMKLENEPDCPHPGSSPLSVELRLQHPKPLD